MPFTEVLIIDMNIAVLIISLIFSFSLTGVTTYETTEETEVVATENADEQALLHEIELSVPSTSAVEKWDVLVESLEDNFSVHHTVNTEDDEKMISASIIKIFVMAAVYDQINDGIIEKTDVSEDLVNMIIYSDNYATNRLINKLGNGDDATGMAVVNEFAREIGCSNVELNRIMLDANGLQNYVTAEDCALILRQIYEGTCVSEQYSIEMLEILNAQTVKNMLPVNLPEGAKIAHKTGSLSGNAFGDVGIVFTENGDYIICAISNFPENDLNAMEGISMVSSIAYDFMIER